MAETPLLQVYRQHLADADFHRAKLQLDAIEQAHASKGEFENLIANERERLEQLGVVLSPAHYHHEQLPTTRDETSPIERQRLRSQHDWYMNAELEECLVRQWGYASPDQSLRS